MAYSRNLLTAGAGLAALYYGVCWLIDGLKIIHVINKAEQSSEAQSLAGMAQIANTVSRDPSFRGGAALSIFQGMHSNMKRTARCAKLLGVGQAAAGGLLLFGAFSAGRSLVTGEAMSNPALLINTGAAVLGAVKGFNRI
jgi:hypothetical protein